MFRYKLDNGKYAYRFQPEDLEQLMSNRGLMSFVIDDEKRTLEIGVIDGEWKKDEDVLYPVRDVDLRSRS